MAQKATHSGTCQACGSAQKLPGGVLAKHGYTVRWGFFSGVCPGSGRKPFETHTDYIAECITFAQGQAKFLRTEGAELRKPATEAKGWYHEYVPAAGRVASYYRWVFVPVGRDAYGSWSVTLENGTTKRMDLYSYPKTELDAATDMNAKKADSLEAQAKKMDEYVAWQQNRLRTWKPAPLVSLEAVAATKKTTVRTKGATVLIFEGTGKPRTRGTVLGSYRDGMWISVTVKTETGVRNVRMSWLTLAE
jgi:hypothetical protein